MTSGWGVDATLDNGVPTSGTSDLDVRKVWGALYSAGIITGCAITTSASSMSYTVASGVVAIKTATGEIVMAPVQGETIATNSAPESGSRTDIIYIKQRFPSDGDSTVDIGVATALPPNALAIGTYTINSGITITNNAVKSGNIDYSVPYGASMGRLYYWQNQYSGPLSNTLLRQGHDSFYLPTDRNVRLSVTACLNAANAVKWDVNQYCEFGFLPQIDGADVLLWATSGLHQAWETFNWSSTVQLNAGNHTVNLGMYRIVGPGTTEAHYGMDGAGHMRPGIEISVVDEGPKK